MSRTQKSKKLLNPEAGALSVLSYSPKAIKQQHTVSIDTKTLLRIEEAKIHLECKGKSQNTLLDGLRREDFCCIFRI